MNITKRERLRRHKRRAMRNECQRLFWRKKNKRVVEVVRNFGVIVGEAGRATRDFQAKYKVYERGDDVREK